MRKIQQKQILDVLKTIDEAQVNGFYADCQEGAIAIGEYIENIKGEGTQTVTLLEEYLDLLVLACNGKASVKTLKRHIIKVENSVKSELKPTKIEVVFLPYKISMWDSLESIYLAAKEDPDCDAYVVPIPSYELNPNGTLGNMYYDGEQYPAELGIINWQDYDIEARQPDVIFIHYAYDDMGSNATVHPVFYSERLKQNCELLIYVPYFVFKGDTMEDYHAYLPGVRNADYIILEEEKHKHLYSLKFDKANKDFNWNNQYGEAKDKFVALGSPKLDKLQKTECMFENLPIEWQKLITDDKGGRKKTILLNTHMFKWLNNPNLTFKKLRDTFTLFKQRDDVVLWWRPHPNTELNFKANRPDLLDDYYHPVNTYKTEGWGIYDDTPDLHRAIAYTDAYYGNSSSSLVILYNSTNKPIMIFNFYVLNVDITHPSISSITNTDDCYWITIWYLNALFKLKKGEEMLELVSEYPVPSKPLIADSVFYGKPILVNNELYFKPLSSNEIAVYSIEDNSFNTYPYADITYDKEVRNAFNGIAHFGKYVYFFPGQYPAIMRFNTVTHEIDYYSDWLEPIKQLLGNKFNPNINMYLSGGSRLVGTTSWHIISNANAILSFDTKTCTSTIHTIGNSEYRYRSIIHDGDNFWLTPRNDTKTPIVKWHPEEGILAELSDIFNSNYPHKNAFGYTFRDENIWMLHFYSNLVLKINTKSNSISENVDFFKDFPTIDAESPVQWHGNHQDLSAPLFFYHQQTGTLYEYCYETDSVKSNKIGFSPDILKDFDKMSQQMLAIRNKANATHVDDAIYIETSALTLGRYINFVLSGSSNTVNENTSNTTEDTQPSVGETIYQFSKSKVI